MKPETAKAIYNLASIAELVARARAAAQPNVAIGRPENAITTKEYAHVTGVSVATAQRHLDKLVANDDYEVIVAMAPTTHGAIRIMAQKFYRKVSNAMDRIR